MKLSANNKNILVKEIRTAAEYMSKANNAQQKMYFFSAVFGISNRLMNLEFDPELVFIHHVTESTFKNINTNLMMMSQGQSLPSIPPSLFNKLEDALVQLANYIEEGNPTYPALERISNLSYSTSGNGYYLFLKGMLKID